MGTVTNYALMQKISEINKKSRTIPTGRQQKVNILDEEGTTALFTQKIVKVQGDTVITDKNQKAKLFNPMPCLFWKCTVAPDKTGVSTLSKAVEGLFIDDGTNIYCLGVAGASDEFEVRFHVGDSEVRVNSKYINLKSEHIVENGSEVM